jgi:cyclopropane-fatty-acyl-phospholipid synthase
VSRVAQLTATAPEEVDVELTFDQLGIDSLAIVELMEELGAWLGGGLEPTLAWDHPTIARLALHLAGGENRIRPVRVRPRAFTAPDVAGRFYQALSKEEDRKRTNKHYELPPRFFEVMTGGRWHVYSCNMWDDLKEPDPENPSHQTLAQEHKLDAFARLLELKPGIRVLDVGAGHGGPLIYLCARYGIRGVGITLSTRQLEYATSWAAREGVDCRFELRHWEDMPVDEPFDAILTDEVIVHFFRLEDFFRKAHQLLRDGGCLVNKEMHFTHQGYGQHLDRFTVLVNDLYGSTGNYRTLAEELTMMHAAGFTVEEVRQLEPVHYYLTATSWHGNLQRREAEMIELVGEELYGNFLKYLTATILGPGHRGAGPRAMDVHFVKARKPSAALRVRLGIGEEAPAEPGR